jgi:hypothetical protein
MAEPAESQLNKRKLDALKRGIHRISEAQTTPCAVHVVGLGKTGADVIKQILEDAPESFLAHDGARFTALAVDIGDQDLASVRALAAKLPSDKAVVRTVALDVPSRDDLFATLRRYREFLKLEYPRYYWNPNYEPWIPSTVELPEAGAHFRRAVAKAIYGKGYYDGARVLDRELQSFANSVDSSQTQSIVCIVFGLGGGTGSSMVVDLARHLSNVKFGRRALILGIGVAPCTGDAPEHRGGSLFPVINELDCMGDGENNQGVITVWGDLYRNPFTGGFLVVPQQPVYDATSDLAATHARVDKEIASLITRNNGGDLWETLRLLNWVGAPPTQHSAARTQYGKKWAHVLGFVDLDKGVAVTDDLRSQLGLRHTYRPEFIELRTASAGDKHAVAAASKLGELFSPLADPEIVESSAVRPGTAQFVLPCISKTDLRLFFESRDAYDTKEWDERLIDHSWLLDLGVMLCEPAIRFDGMAGECLWGCACWVVVPYEGIRGPAEKLEAAVAE